MKSKYITFGAPKKITTQEQYAIEKYFEPLGWEVFELLPSGIRFNMPNLVRRNELKLIDLFIGQWMHFDQNNGQLLANRSFTKKTILELETEYQLWVVNGGKS